MKKFLFGVIIAFVSLSCGGRDANSQEKVDTLSICDDKDVTSSTEPPQFDNDSTISESPNPIEAITKSIADGDASKLASLTLFPIGRRYPLRDIKDSSDMVRRFYQIFDRKFRNRMKSSSSSDWHNHGWRGDAYGEDGALWVYDSLTMINYYSPKEKELYRQLVKKEMNSLHKSLRGKGWYPYCCYKDITDGSILRVDAKTRKAEYQIEDIEMFRLSLYSKGYNLKGKPQMVLKGTADIGGSAQMVDYVFKEGNNVIEFGDSYYEDGKKVLMIKEDGKELLHEMEPCYWLDLIL